MALLHQAGLKHAMVSNSSDEGTQRLRAAAPDLVLPLLRPYRNRCEIGSWMRDDSVIAHLESRLKRFHCVGLGEHHIHGADADLPVIRRVVELARGLHGVSGSFPGRHGHLHARALVLRGRARALIAPAARGPAA